MGANDINFNIRSDAFYIHEKKKQNNVLFATVIEPHGTYNYVTEIPNTPKSEIKSIEALTNTANYTVLKIENIHNTEMLVFFSNNTSESKKHTINIAGKSYNWTGTNHKLILKN